MQQIDRTDEALQPGSTSTPFSAFFWTALSGDLATAEAQYADDVEWDMMPNNQIRKGEDDVIPWLWAGGYASRKEPVVINNLATKEWGSLSTGISALLPKI